MRKDPIHSLSLLTDLSESILHSPDDESLLEQISYLSRELIGADGACLWFLDSEKGDWFVASSFGVGLEIPKIRAKPASELIGKAIDQDGTIYNKVFLIRDIASDPLTQEQRELYIAQGFRGLLAIPLSIENQNSGVIAFYFRTHVEISEAEVRICTIFANIVSLALTAARYQKKLQEKAQGN